MAQYKGIVKWFSNAKDYGFIGGEGAPDVFCHYSAVQNDGYKTLEQGDSVEFNVVQGDKGSQADSVTRIGSSSQESSGPGLKTRPTRQAETV